MHSIDAIPLGDIGESIFVLVTNPYDVDVVATIRFKGQEKVQFKLDTREIKIILDGVPFSEPTIMVWLKEYIKSNLS